MLKKILILCSILAMMAALFAGIQLTAAAADTDFRVGYSRVDINPYVVDGDFSSGIMELPLRGSGDVWNRLSTYGLVDDNADGVIDENDGLKVTCIAVTDSEDNTILMITIDLIGGALIAQVREEICTRVEAALASGELSDVKLSDEQIYYAGTHTHNAPDTTVYNASGKTGTNNEGKDLSVLNENLGIWIDRTIEDIGDAAILALKDRAAATVTKDTIKASQDTREPVAGKVMNSVRHYYNYDKNGKLVCYAGDNFNTRGSNPKQVNEVNDAMNLVRFSFAAGSGKTDIILANWRGHPSLNNNNDYNNSSKNAISSDYVNAFRHALEHACSVSADGTGTYQSEQVYRVAFFNGEGGNVNPRGREKDTSGKIVGQWIDDMANANSDSRANVYGRILCALAQHGLESESGRQAVDPGEIRTIQYVYNADRKNNGYSDLAYEAAMAYQAEAATKTMSHPYRYTNAAGETYVIGSRFHASNIVSHWNTALQMSTEGVMDMELNAFMIGEDLAFVTAPGEPFDYYYNEDGSNAWLNLISETYGTPFVLGYCNGAKGYIPNIKAYEYETDATKYAIGSYESHITPYAKGSGEKMIGYFEQMLTLLEAGKTYDRESYCQHCGQSVIWNNYTGRAELNSGHYYLTDDVNSAQIHILAGAEACFDMNGHTLTGVTRAFYTASGGGATLNLMDTSPDQTGVVRGCGGSQGASAGWGGGVLIVDKTNTLNFYSGTLEMFENGFHAASNGGVIRNRGTVNMYGGTIRGGISSSFTGEYVKSGVPTKLDREGSGAAVNNAGTFNVYGGTVEAGSLKLITGQVSADASGIYRYSQTVTERAGKGISFYTTGKVTLGGNANVADIYLDGDAASLLSVDTTATPFTGLAQLTCTTTPVEGTVVGTCTGSHGIAGALMVSGTGMNVKTSGNRLIVAAGAIMLMDGNTCYASFDSIKNAVAAYTWSGSNYIRLSKNVRDDITVDKTVYLDLNGYCLTGQITVNDGVGLFCMDSQTDDYTIDDELSYGMLTGKLSGNIAAAEDYIRINEQNGVSFHRVDLEITTMALRPSAVGVYYKAPFAADEIVADHVKSYGICLSVENAAAAQAMTPGTYSVYTDFAPGATGNQTASTMVAGIMKTGNSGAVNASNAATVIYGCAYLQTDGGFVFGKPVGMSLQQQIEAVDGIWRTLSDKQKDYVLALRFRYGSVMESWKIPNILS